MENMVNGGDVLFFSGSLARFSGPGYPQASAPPLDGGPAKRLGFMMTLALTGNRPSTKRTVETASRRLRIAFALLPLIAASACTSTPAPAGPGSTSASLASTSVAEDAAQPMTATYNCADGDRMTIENLGTSIRLLGSDGLAEELPASPADQRSRYGEAHEAIVLEGREALVMKGGQPPLTCTR